MSKKFEKADARSSRDWYRVTVGILVITVFFLGLALFITRENLIDCTIVVRHLETLL